MNLGGGRGVGSMACPTQKPDEFPVGLRVLVVDDDPTCLKILERMLITCRYEVTKCNRVEYALNELRMNKDGFDVVISDVHMPNMDGFKLLEHVGLEMDLPVIMMSADDSKSVVMKGIKHGACDYLTKPVRMDALKNIWQHVVRKKKNERQELEPWERGQRHAANEDDWKSSKRKGGDEEADDYASFKKARVVWSVELHQQFVAAVDCLGIDNAVPKKILELMNVPGLTRENVASHLQKYRLCLSKLTEEPHLLGGDLNNPLMGPPNTVFGAMTSLGGIDLQALSGFQPTPSRPPINSAISTPFHQTNASGLETSNFRLPEVQQHLQQLSNSNMQGLAHGIPAAMEMNQLTRFYQYADSLKNMNMYTDPQISPSLSSLMQMVRPQPKLSTGAPYTSLPQSSQIVDIPVNHVPAFTGLVQEQANLNTEGSREFDPSYDLLDELYRQEPQDWQIAGLSSGGVHHTSSIDNISVSPSLFFNQGFSWSPNQGDSKNIIDGNTNVLPTSPEPQLEGNTLSGNNLLADTVSSSVKPAAIAQELSSGSSHSFELDKTSSDDLLSIMLKQQEEGTGPLKGEFNFDGYALEDLW